MIVYRDERVRIHGWNHVGTDQTYRDVVVDLGRESVAALLAGFDQGESTAGSEKARYPGSGAAVGLGDRGSDTRYLWHYKPKPRAYLGVSRESWINLRELWNEMREKPGLNDPNLVEQYAGKMRR